MSTPQFLLTIHLIEFRNTVEAGTESPGLFLNVNGWLIKSCVVPTFTTEQVLKRAWEITANPSSRIGKRGFFFFN